MEKASYYQLCGQKDIVSLVKHLLDSGAYRMREDGKLVGDMTMGWDSPWEHVVHSHHLDCNLWHKIMFDQLGRKFVPSKCQNCYKVVVRPKNLRQLFALRNIEVRLGRPAKLGIETRETVHGNYGGYFYNLGMEEGLERYKEVRKAVDEDEVMGPDVGVLLKRACTEFEHAFGDSDKWEITDAQMEVEKLVEEWFANDIIYRVQPPHIVHRVHRGWIQYAYKIGDPTYADFTNGEPLYPPYVTYHHLAEEKEDDRTGEKDDTGMDCSGDKGCACIT